MTPVYAEYGRKINTIKAVLVAHDNAAETADWCDGYLVEETDLEGNITYGINYESMGNMARVSEGQYLVMAGDGIWYTKDKADFEAAFEKKEN